MKIGIVGAMAQEVEILKGLMADKIEKKVASAVIFEGKLMENPLPYCNRVSVKSLQQSARLLYCNRQNRMW
ncbi:5'-methylthioadenosine/S-adenosylhomocysteine nucleosidase [Rodentibacter pneumotropicus]|uniref:5'-methylthioadenosine/S-adenosylhomocysteine nucleosidase n=1 Tax=Rodentibacter pneumotropicus TaxID=758 RepID=A0A3S4TZU6_9PAST|nr:5'-methylthioadenosine/S-adenosylhomocysteine nucleosidase [Rodentibacter pneumotropicus]